MDVIDLVLSSGNDLIESALRLNDVVLSASDPIIFGIVKDPFFLCRHIESATMSVRHLSSRAYLVNNEFVYKYDEQDKANSLTFIANLFAKIVEVHAPEIILSDRKRDIPGINYDGDEKVVQIIEYLPEWEDYSDRHDRPEDFPEQLAVLLAFDLVVGNGDRFLFIFSHIDNALFADDLEYEQVDLWDEPAINKGNFGFIGDRLWSMDHRGDYDMEDLYRIHQLLTSEFLGDCSMLMGKYFSLTVQETARLSTTLKNRIERNLVLFPVFEKLHKYIL